MVVTRRERLLVEGMRLFGERGYAATSVAQIEEAAGLSPGSGSMYKHFRSKRELLEAGLDELLCTGDLRLPSVAREPAGAADPADAVAILEAAARAGFARMEEDRDLSRVLFRDLDAFPDLLERFGREEIARIQQGTATFLAGLAETTGNAEPVDWAAIAAILQAAVAHYWLLEDRFGAHPTGVPRARFVNALAGLAAAAVTPSGTPVHKETK